MSPERSDARKIIPSHRRVAGVVVGGVFALLPPAAVGEAIYDDYFGGGARLITAAEANASAIAPPIPTDLANGAQQIVDVYYQNAPDRSGAEATVPPLVLEAENVLARADAHHTALLQEKAYNGAADRRISNRLQSYTGGLLTIVELAAYSLFRNRERTKKA